jgi:PhzF family phenazine biosynthesis protein
MPIPLFHVDAFTDRPFAGNPAAVCLLPLWKEDRWLQAVAREMNLSETAFLVWQPDHFDLRWFTPKTEVELCGHATLASPAPECLPDAIAGFGSLSIRIGATLWARSSRPVFASLGNRPYFPSAGSVAPGL